MDRNISPRRTRSSNRLANLRLGAMIRNENPDLATVDPTNDVDVVGHEQIVYNAPAVAENEGNDLAVTVDVYPANDPDLDSANDTIELDDSEDLSVIDLTEEDATPDRSLIAMSPIRLGSHQGLMDLQMSTNFRSSVRKFLRDCHFEQQSASEVAKVTFRNIRNLWDEKVGRSLCRSEKQVLKELSSTLLRNLLVGQSSSSAETVDLTDSPVKSSPKPGEGLGLQCPVCLDPLADLKKSGVSVLATTCGHIFCSTCLPASLAAVGGRCPTCRHRLSKKDYHKIFI